MASGGGSNIFCIHRELCLLLVMILQPDSSWICGWIVCLRRDGTIALVSWTFLDLSLDHIGKHSTGSSPFRHSWSGTINLHSEEVSIRKTINTQALAEAAMFSLGVCLMAGVLLVEVPSSVQSSPLSKH